MGIIYKNGIPYGNQPPIDATLTHQGEAADAKATGDEIGDVKAMIETSVEESATSAHAYAVGEHFIYNDTLYRATAAIAIGDTITPDTNCVATNVMTEVESGGGGGGGTSDYTQLSNKPQINGVTLTGNKSLSDIGAASQSDLEALEDITGDGALSGFTATDLTGAANELKNTLTQLDQNMAYVESGNTASRTYAAGDYISWKGTLYTANGTISSGQSFSTGSGGNLSLVDDGGLNDLKESITLYGLGGKLWKKSGSFRANHATDPASRTFTFTGAVYAVMYITGTNASRLGMYLVFSNGTSATIAKEIVAGSDITVTTNSNTLTATNTSNSIAIVQIMFFDKSGYDATTIT
jgi:hypothetical protein